MPIKRIYEPFSEEAYDVAIQNLLDAKTQLFPDAKNCAVCGDNDHQVFACNLNVMVLAIFSRIR